MGRIANRPGISSELSDEDLAQLGLSPSFAYRDEGSFDESKIEHTRADDPLADLADQLANPKHIANIGEELKERTKRGRPAGVASFPELTLVDGTEVEEPLTSTSGSSSNSNSPDVVINERAQRVESVAHLKAFEVWVACNQNFNRAAAQLGCAHMSLRRYAKWFDWEERAKARVEAAASISQSHHVAQTAKMLTSHYDAAHALLEKGLKYLEEYGIDNPRDAIAAIRVGVQIQRQVTELPDSIVQIGKASDQDLYNRAREIMEEFQAASIKPVVIDSYEVNAPHSPSTSASNTNSAVAQGAEILKEDFSEDDAQFERDLAASGAFSVQGGHGSDEDEGAPGYSGRVGEAWESSGSESDSGGYPEREQFGDEGGGERLLALPAGPC